MRRICMHAAQAGGRELWGQGRSRPSPQEESSSACEESRQQRTPYEFSDLHPARRGLATPNFTCEGRNRAFTHPPIPVNIMYHRDAHTCPLSVPHLWRTYGIHLKQGLVHYRYPSLSYWALSPDSTSSYSPIMFAIATSILPASAQAPPPLPPNENRPLGRGGPR